jgi:ABC-type microcin C transport system permease subunit YejB
MELSELLMLIGLLVPGLLLSVLIMVAFAAGG